MEETGRDAIYLDFLNRPGQFTDDDAAHYDLVVKSSEVKDAKALRALIEQRVKPEALAAWRNFLAAREPEKREPNPNVANYEKRPKPLTFQHPFSVKGSMERTQVPADMRLRTLRQRAGHHEAHRLRVGRARALWVAETRDYPHGVSRERRGQ